MSRYFLRNAFIGGALLCLTLLSSCASLGLGGIKKNAGYEVELGQDSYLRAGDDAPVFKKEGEKVVVRKLPLWVEAPGYVSVLMVAPPAVKKEEVKVDLKAQDSWSSEAFNRKLTSSVIDVVSGVTEVQSLLARREPEQAYTKFLELEKKYPQIHWLGFLKASCLLVLGKVEEAKMVLTSTLQEYPNDASGQALHKVLFSEKSVHE